jgi:hypothetical protein
MHETPLKSLVYKSRFVFKATQCLKGYQMFPTRNGQF